MTTTVDDFQADDFAGALEAVLAFPDAGMSNNVNVIIAALRRAADDRTIHLVRRTLPERVLYFADLMEGRPSPPEIVSAVAAMRDAAAELERTSDRDALSAALETVQRELDEHEVRIKHAVELLLANAP